jgi:hypothetical protein
MAASQLFAMALGKALRGVYLPELDLMPGPDV